MDEQRHRAFFDAAVKYLTGEPMPELPPLPGRVHRQRDGDGRDRLAEQWAAGEQPVKPGWLGPRP